MIDDDPFVINSSMNINHVHLNVTDLSKSLDFYKSILGFRILKEDLQTNTVYLALDPFNEEIMETLNPRTSLIVLTQIKDSFDPKNLDKSKKRKRVFTILQYYYPKENIWQLFYEI